MKLKIQRKKILTLYELDLKKDQLFQKLNTSKQAKLGIFLTFKSRGKNISNQPSR